MMRLSKEKKQELARELSERVVKMMTETDRLKGSGLVGRRVRIGQFTILYMKPPPACDSFLVEIWDEHRTVFSMSWPPEKTAVFRYGIWMNDFVPGSFVERP